MAIRLLSCLGVELELPLLRHFLVHYGKLGLAPGHIHLILNATEAASPALAEAEAIAANAGLPPPRRWIAPYTSETMWAERRALQREVARPGDWIVNADIDEHHAYPDALQAVVAHCHRVRATAVQGVMVDRLGPEGRLAPVRDAPELARQFPVEADLAVSLFGRRRGQGLDGTFKLMLHRADVFPHRGGHRAMDEAAPRYLVGRRLGDVAGMDDPARRLAFPFRVHHYKWTAGRVPKIERRLATPGVSADGQHFGSVTLDYLAEHGRIRLADVAVAAPGQEAARTGWRRKAFALRIGSALHRVRAGKR